MMTPSHPPKIPLQREYIQKFLIVPFKKIFSKPVREHRIRKREYGTTRSNAGYQPSLFIKRQEAIETGMTTSKEDHEDTPPF